MPIRHCQKCSLKVLIDESQAGVSPFYCQRCTAALKSDGGGAEPAPSPAARRASSPRLTPVPAPAAVAVAAPPSAGKSTVKVFCPYCKASFNGKIPSKPARGSCPLCQKDLILLPNGDIKPAADFDLAKWQAEGSGGQAKEKESGTVALVKKFAASSSSTSDSAEAGVKIIEDKASPSPAEETQSPEEGVELPSWLDESDRMKRKSSEPVLPPPDTDEAVPVRLEDLENAEPAEPEPDLLPEPPPAKRSGSIPKVSPPPIPAKTATQPVQTATASVPAVGKKAALRREKTERRAAPAGDVATTTSGPGKFMLSLLLTALPVAACPILLSSKEKMESFLGPMGARFVKGFKELDTRLFPVEVEKPKPPPPKPREPEPEAPAKPTAEDQRNMEDEINKRWMEYKREERTVKQLSVGANPEQKAEIEKAQAELKTKHAHIDQLRATYKKLFGKDHDPTKE
ncbi:MAG TPA: hypothetical protein VF950_00890 [Planctomycetota bacterium]